MKLNKQHIILGFIFFSIGFFILFTVAFGSLLFYSRISLESQFEGIPLPPQTIQIGDTTKYIFSSKGGNTCFINLSKIIRSELSLDELDAYYHDFPIQTTNGTSYIFVSLDKTKENTFEISIQDGKDSLFHPYCEMEYK